jgi:hypothetical protein
MALMLSVGVWWQVWRCSSQDDSDNKRSYVLALYGARALTPRDSIEGERRDCDDGIDLLPHHHTCSQPHCANDREV